MYSHHSLWIKTIKVCCFPKVDFELCCWRLLRIPWTTRRSNQSVPKEMNPDYSLEVQFSSVTQSCLTLCDPMDCSSTPGLFAHHQLLEFTQTHVHWVSDAIQPSHPLSSLSTPDFNLSQHQGLFKWVSFSYQVAKILEFQLQHQSFQWTPRTKIRCFLI